jgi:hypothetical protein
MYIYINIFIYMYNYTGPSVRDALVPPPKFLTDHYVEENHSNKINNSYIPSDSCAFLPYKNDNNGSYCNNDNDFENIWRVKEPSFDTINDDNNHDHNNNNDHIYNNIEDRVIGEREYDGDNYDPLVEIPCGIFPFNINNNNGDHDNYNYTNNYGVDGNESAVIFPHYGVKNEHTGILPQTDNDINDSLDYNEGYYDNSIYPTGILPPYSHPKETIPRYSVIRKPKYLDLCTSTSTRGILQVIKYKRIYMYI